MSLIKNFFANEKLIQITCSVLEEEEKSTEMSMQDLNLIKVAERR